MCQNAAHSTFFIFVSEIKVHFTKSHKMKLNYCILLISGIFFFTSCSVKDNFSVGNIENLKIKGFESKTVLCQAEIEIDNRNCMAFSLVANELKVFASDKILGNIEITNPVKIKAKEKKVFVIDFKFILEENQSGVFSVVQNFTSGNHDIVIRGNLKARSFLYSKKIPIDMKLF
jgi:hypothetical protein